MWIKHFKLHVNMSPNHIHLVLLDSGKSYDNFNLKAL